MIKDVLYKIMESDRERETLRLLRDKSDIYDLFCKNGYRKTFDDFKIEINNFLKSADSLKILSRNFDELSDDMLELVAGGIGKKIAVVAGVASMLAVFGMVSTMSVGAAPKVNIPYSSSDSNPSNQSQENGSGQNNNENTKAKKIYTNLKADIEKVLTNIATVKSCLDDSISIAEDSKLKNLENVKGKIENVISRLDYFKNLENINNMDLVQKLAGIIRKDLSRIESDRAFIFDQLKNFRNGNFGIYEKASQNLDYIYNQINNNNTTNNNANNANTTTNTTNTNNANNNNNNSTNNNNNNNNNNSINNNNINQNGKNNSKNARLEKRRTDLKNRLQKIKDDFYKLLTDKNLSVFDDVVKGIVSRLHSSNLSNIRKESNCTNEDLDIAEKHLENLEILYPKLKESVEDNIKQYEKSNADGRKLKLKVCKLLYTFQNEILKGKLENGNKLREYLNNNFGGYTITPEQFYDFNRIMIEEIIKRGIGEKTYTFLEDKRERMYSYDREGRIKKVEKLKEDGKEIESVKWFVDDKEIPLKEKLKIDTYTMKELLAGNQNEGNEVYKMTEEVKKLFNKKYSDEETIRDTCAIHMATTLTNIFDRMEDKNSKPVKGVSNVLENFRKNGGNMKYIGEFLSFDDIKGFLNKKGVSNYVLNIECMGRTEDEFNKLKSTVKKIVKNLLKTYMKGKDFAPIGTVAGAHWQLLVKYDENKDAILRLDSAPCEARWVSLDTIVANTLNPENGKIHVELPFFAKNKVKPDNSFLTLGTDDISKAKVEDILKKINEINNNNNNNNSINNNNNNNNNNYNNNNRMNMNNKNMNNNNNYNNNNNNNNSINNNNNNSSENEQLEKRRTDLKDRLQKIRDDFSGWLKQNNLSIFDDVVKNINRELYNKKWSNICVKKNCTNGDLDIAKEHLEELEMLYPTLKESVEDNIKQYESKADGRKLKLKVCKLFDKFKYDKLCEYLKNELGGYTITLEQFCDFNRIMIEEIIKRGIGEKICLYSQEAGTRTYFYDDEYEIKKVEELKEDGEDGKEIKSVKWFVDYKKIPLIDTYTMEELLAGNQNYNASFKEMSDYVKKAITREKGYKLEDKTEIIQTCAIHMATTLTNIFDRLKDIYSEPVQGVSNVLENFKKNDGSLKDICQPLSFGDIKPFLEKKEVSTYEISFDCAYDKKDKVKKILENLLKTYMKGKDFAPIGTPGYGHWVLLTRYDENTNRILKVDSSPCEAKWVDFDELIDKVVFTSSSSYDESGFSLCFFAKNKGKCKSEGRGYFDHNFEDNTVPSVEDICKEINSTFN